MKVKALIKLLQDENPDAEVIVSSDPEGNSYHKLYQVGESAYVEAGYGVEIGLLKLTAADKKAGYGEEDVLENGKPAVVFWPE